MNGIKNMLLGIAIILLYLLGHIGIELDIIIIIGVVFILYGYFCEYFSKNHND